MLTANAEQLLLSTATIGSMYCTLQMNGDKIIVKVIKRDTILSVEMIM